MPNIVLAIDLCRLMSFDTKPNFFVKHGLRLVNFFKIYETLYLYLFLVVINLTAQQNCKVIYKVVKMPEHPVAQTILQQQGKDFYQNRLKKYDRIYSIAKDFDFILTFNSKESRYEWQEEMRDETINEYFWVMAKLLGGGMSVQYQNRQDSLLMRQGASPVDYKIYRETSSLYKYQWQITTERDTILGYPVIKAISERYVAWFTPNIPVPFGPNGFGGLPGLILKLYITKQFPAYALVATQIRLYNKLLKIKKPVKGVLRTEKQRREARIKQINR